MPYIGIDHDPFGMLLVGRNWEIGSEYRYGFQGIEKNINAGLDFYFADYRPYNQKLARWISIDPLYKSYVTNYCAFSNSPITRVDPRGDDDYFDIDGNYVGSDNKVTNHIWILKSNNIIAANDFYVIQKDGSKLVDPKYQDQEYAFKPSAFYYAENKSDPNNGGTNTKAIAYNNMRLKKILGYYFVEPILTGKIDETAAAYYSKEENQFYYAINKNGKISFCFDNADDLKSVICDHEDIHKEDHKNPKFTMTFLRHAEIYVNQIQSDQFTNTTEMFQRAMIIGAVDRYFSAYYDVGDLGNAIDNLNKVLREQGIHYQVTDVTYQGKGSYKITNTNDKSCTTHNVVPPKNPSD